MVINASILTTYLLTYIFILGAGIVKFKDHPFKKQALPAYGFTVTLFAIVMFLPYILSL